MNNSRNGTISDCKISTVLTKQNVYPFVASFQNGKLRTPSEVNVSGGIYTDIKQSSKDSKKNVIITLNDMLYTGVESAGDSRNLIAVRNRTTGDVRLIEVGSVLLKALPSKELEEKENAGKPMLTKTTGAELSAAFGSKRSKRVQEQSKRLKIDADTMVDQLEKAINEKQIKDEDITLHNVDSNDVADRYAPPINRAATDVAGVYSIDSILNEEQLAALGKAAHHVLESEECQINITEYISTRIKELKNSDKEDKILLCSLLIYTDCLISFLLEPYRKMSSLKYEACSYSRVINTLILEEFTIANEKSRTRSQTLKDKAICYILVLLLLANDFVISNIGELGKVINLPTTKMAQLAKVIGANSNKESIILKLPLVQPPTVFLKKSKK